MFVDDVAGVPFLNLSQASFQKAVVHARTGAGHELDFRCLAFRAAWKTA